MPNKKKSTIDQITNPAIKRLSQVASITPTDI